MSKRIRVSTDSGVNWYTLPGNTGELQSSADMLDDTIFGQDFGSTQTNLINWTLSANALYKGFAGYVASVKRAGSPTTFTGEAMAQVGSSLTYRISDGTKNLWDRLTTIVVSDDGSPVADSNIQYIDYLFGQVTFITGYTVTGAVTVAGKYIPTTAFAGASSYSLTQEAATNDITTLELAQANDGHAVYEYGLKSVSVDIDGIYAAANGYLDSLINRTEVVIEICPDGNSKAVARGFFKPASTGQSGDVGATEEGTISYQLSVPDDEKLPYPFHWNIAADVTLNRGVVNCLSAWENKQPILVAYLPDGTTGKKGSAIITNMTMEGGVGALNEFSFEVQGSGELSDYS